MKRIALGLAMAVLLPMAGGCATHASSKLGSASTLAAADRPGGSEAEQSAAGLEAMAWEDKWTASNLFAHAQVSHRTVINQFNEATSYQRTRRLPDAAAIYRRLLVEGRYTTAVSGGSNYTPELPRRRFNIAEESARRLAVIELAMAYADKLAGSVAGTNAATTTPQVSDETARQRDEAAERPPGA